MENDRSVATVEEAWNVYVSVFDAARQNKAYKGKIETPEDPPRLEGMNETNFLDFCFYFEDSLDCLVHEDEMRKLVGDKRTLHVSDFRIIGDFILERKYGERN